LNLAHNSLEHEKQPETRTTRRTILMSQFDEEEEKETLLNR
jgi:hypothetical protein